MDLGNILSPAQLVGYVYFAFSLCAVSQKDERKLRTLIVFSAVLGGVHYLLMGSTVTAISMFIGAFRNIIAIKYRSYWIASFFVATYAIVGINYMADSLVNLLPIIRSIISTIGMSVFEGIKMRVIALVAGLCAIANSYLLGSYGGFLMDVTIFILGLITLVRILHAKKKTSLRLQ